MTQLAHRISAWLETRPGWLVGGVVGGVMTLIGAAGVLGWILGDGQTANPFFVLSCWLMVVLGPLGIAGAIIVEREKRRRRNGRNKPARR